MGYKGNREKHSPDAFEGAAKSLLLHSGLGGKNVFPLRRLLTNTAISLSPNAAKLLRRTACNDNIFPHIADMKY